MRRGRRCGLSEAISDEEKTGDRRTALADAEAAFADSGSTDGARMPSIEDEVKGMRRTEIEAIALPLVLLITGLVLLGGDRVGVLSLDRIQNLWPLAFLLVGLSDLVASGEKRKGSRRG